ncbi:3-hydroxyisobutyryl-CoA hydrolase 1-like [Rosa rugosa]|uniref:3-hydroxyisobutyryl-CoA hydrolase 1-like n=1 Tax=Rosa rugosa TaxID=74645 RepID=UPI002B411308|nr:3-hydroxyisobutyryl-CoA hydrolase 1-like [Rosa rugosa]XP_062000695.1 3-hydroxyisobutyryl-CoA hydrolase 1-like [Rosa rugosa]
MASFINSDEDDQILIQQNLFARMLTLNRPRQLNALSFEMLSQLSQLFQAYEDDANVKLIILKGKGRAFCAGGDVAVVARHLFKGNWRFGAQQGKRVYTLGYLIATNTTPQVSVLNGIVMGGGAGVSIHGRFRVATENSVFALPETALGLFPDLGASSFLSRLPGFFGEYLGLTGARLDGPEMLACGLATHFVPSAKLASLEEALASKIASTNISSGDLADNISAIINQYSMQPAIKEKSACYKMDVIDECFSKRSVEEILSALEKELATIGLNGCEWLSSSIESLKKASPISLKITLRSIREGRMQGVGECLVREYRMVCHVVRGEISKDFREGCRAILLDKDKNPKWEPCKLELITDEMVDHYFSKLDGDEELEELKLPERSNLYGIAIAKL